MRGRLSLILSLLPVLLLVPIEARALQIYGHNVRFDPSTQMWRFSITLSGVPDFLTLDSFGRPKDSFQYWISWDINGQPNAFPDVLIRGDEIHTSSGIPIRDRTGNGGPNSGGWGPIRGVVPYLAYGSSISIDVPAALIGDSDGRVAYYFGIFTFGGTTDFRSGLSNFPTPTIKSSWGRIKTLYK